jgi:peptidoglycan/xylan/chitin deacetylase (PgdA/CDA1 family)
VKLHWLQDRPTYIVAVDGKQTLVDARDGSMVAAPNKEQIQGIADFWFTGEEQLTSLSLIDELPGEVRGRKPPLWRAEFGGWNKPTLYLSPATGELLTRRHELWRIFDFAWMLHIMDYNERENVNNWLLRTFTWAAVLMALSGAWLLLYSFPRRRRRKVQ